MKNRQLEWRYRAARQYHRNDHNASFVECIVVEHDYQGVNANALSWWDDVQFILGGRRIAISWQHPRNVYKGLIENAAMAAAAPLYENIEGGLFEDAEPVFKSVGRSRKKISSFTTKPHPSERAWVDALSAHEERLSKEVEFSISPSIKVRVFAWCRHVEIVAPVEIRNVAELRSLADLVRRILKRQTTLDQEFPGYVYGKTQWIEEGHTDRPLRVVSHRVVGS